MKARALSLIRTLLLALALLLPLAGHAAGQAPASPVPWTVMIYMDGDNDLENWVIHDIEHELGRAGSNSDVNVLVLADRIPGYSHARGDWTTTKLFYVHKGMRALPGLPQYRAEYDAAWRDTQRVADPFNKNLYDAAVEIKAHVPDADIQARSQAVIDAMNSSVVLYEWHANHRYADAHGIGIFWPQRPEDLTDSKSPQFEWACYRDHLLFSQQTHWDGFLGAYVNW